MSWKPIGGINRNSSHNIVSSNFNNSVFNRVSSYIGDSSGLTILNSNLDMSNNSIFDISAVYVNNLIDLSVSQPIMTGNILYHNNNNLYWGNQILNGSGVANLYWEDVAGVTTTKVNDNVRILGDLDICSNVTIGESGSIGFLSYAGNSSIQFSDVIINLSPSLGIYCGAPLVFGGDNNDGNIYWNETENGLVFKSGDSSGAFIGNFDYHDVNNTSVFKIDSSNDVVDNNMNLDMADSKGIVFSGSTVPGDTTNKLYRSGSSLYWNGNILDNSGVANLYWEDIAGVTTTKVNNDVKIIGDLQVNEIFFDNSSVITEISQNSVYIGTMLEASGQLFLDSSNNLIQIGNGSSNTSAIRIGNSGNKNVYLGNPDSSNIELFSSAKIVSDCSDIMLKANTISIGKGDSVKTTIGEAHSTYFSSFVNDLCNNSITIGAPPSWITDFNNSNPTSVFQLIPGNLTSLHEIKGNLLGNADPTPAGQPYPNGQYFSLVIGVAGTGYGYFYTVNRIFNSGNNPGSNVSLSAPIDALFNNIAAPRQIYGFLSTSIPTEAIGSIYFYNNNGLTFPNESIIPGPIVPQSSYNIAEIVSDTIKIGSVSSTIDFSGSVAHFAVPNVNISGNLSKTSGSFKIDHPLDSMNTEYYLIHSFVESNQPDNIYTGSGILNKNGETNINLDEYFNLTNGTMISLNRNIRIMVIGNGFNACWKLDSNLLKINGSESGEFTFQVIGERKDPHIQKFWENDKYITEIKK